jgi:RHS repeat-associated protein
MRIELPGRWPTKTMGTGEWSLSGTAAITVPVTNVAVLNSGGSEYVSREVRTNYLPAYTESYGYDLDGNLTSDGLWTYTWDAENRLVRMVANNSVAPQQRLDFEYDWQGRRIGKKVWNNTSGSGDPAVNLKFLYDGWNLVAELSSANVLVRAEVWGTDLAGAQGGSASMQGADLPAIASATAGGVGGLLKVTHYGNTTTNAFVVYDGNGNVAALFDASANTLLASYEYGFGEVIRATEPMAKANPFRLSTKYQDDETDLLYYGYRYYNASTGRWISRDPLGELGFDVIRIDDDEDRTVEPNHYAFVGNVPITRVDFLGLRSCKEICRAILDTAVPPPIGGFVGCENGKKCACNAPWSAMGYNPGDCPDIDKSVLKHEKKHFDEVSCPKGCGLQIAPWKDDMTGADKEKSECERAEEDIKTLKKLVKKLTGNCQDVAKKLLDYKEKYVQSHNCDAFKKK